MSAGYFSVSGYTVDSNTGQRTNLGPFSIPMSSIGDVVKLALSAGTTTVAIPAGAEGVAIIPPIGVPPAGVTLKYKTVSGDSGIFVSTQEPTIHEFDTVNNEAPSTIYLVASGNIEVSVQIL